LRGIDTTGPLRVHHSRFGTVQEITVACDFEVVSDGLLADAGFIDQDFELYINEWQSDYLMVDSVGATAPFAGGKNDPRYYASTQAIYRCFP